MDNLFTRHADEMFAIDTAWHELNTAEDNLRIAIEYVRNAFDVAEKVPSDFNMGVFKNTVASLNEAHIVFDDAVKKARQLLTDLHESWNA